MEWLGWIIAAIPIVLALAVWGGVCLVSMLFE